MSFTRINLSFRTVSLRLRSMDPFGLSPEKVASLSALALPGLAKLGLWPHFSLTPCSLDLISVIMGLTKIGLN